MTWKENINKQKQEKYDYATSSDGEKITWYDFTVTYAILCRFVWWF